MILNKYFSSLCLFLISQTALAAQLDRFVIKNVEVRTITNAKTLLNTHVLIENGRIKAIGQKISIPANTKTIDGRGQILTPGIFAAETELALKEIDGVEETNDTRTSQSRFSAALDVTDALNPRSAALAVNRIEGVTSAAVVPGLGINLIAGQGAIISLIGDYEGDKNSQIKTSQSVAKDFIIKSRAVMVATYGERSAKIAGSSRSAAMAKLREAFEEVKSNGLRLKGGLSNESQLSSLDIEALKPVLQGKVPLLLYVDRASDIRASLRLAHDYGLKLIIIGGAEAWLVASELAQKNVPVLLDPTADLPDRFESLNVRPDAAQILLKAKVKIAFTGGNDSAGPRNLRQSAGIAVARGGLSADEALAAITLNPAQIFGLSRDYGSVSVGKKADLVLWNGDPLELATSAQKVWIGGVEIPAVSRQTLLRDKYLSLLKEK